MSANSTTIVRPPLPPGPVRWLKRNLFNNWYNSLLTVVCIALLFLVSTAILNWVFFSANWSPITQRLTLLAVGQYPRDQLWRVGSIVFMISFFSGLSWRVWGGTVRTFGLTLVVFFSILAFFPLSFSKVGLDIRLWFLANPILTFVGYQVGRSPIGKSRWVLLGWLVSFVLAIILLAGIKGVSWLPPVDTIRWGGLSLTFLLALVGIVASFPIGVLLALGRQSSLPVVKTFCVLFIEVIRGVPLVTILFMFSLLLPLFLPPDIRIDRMLRAMIGMTLFAAAYMAENIRGGLQAIPQGQIEATKAVGLNSFQTMTFIVLPQALRLVIPAIVGQFIALFMDTTLVTIVNLQELLGMGKSVLESKVEWKLLNMEMYVFIAIIFWVFNFAMSYASRQLEAALGVGER